MNQLGVIKIYGLRPYPNSKTGRMEIMHVPHKPTFDKIQDVFNPELVKKALEQIPKKEHWNLYFTPAQCHKNLERDLESLHCLYFDIDKLDGVTTEEVKANSEKAARAACQYLNVEYEKVGVIFSGNGVQMFILLDYPISSVGYIKETRPHYSDLCRQLGIHLAEQGISGHMDVKVWSPARLMRLPLTENRKHNKEIRVSEILNGNLEPYALDLKMLGKPDTPAKDRTILKSFGEPDTGAVMKECQFLDFVKSNQEKVSEPEWYAALSITANLENGTELSHEISRDYSEYDFDETQAKIEQALERAGPSTCAHINTMWGKCQACPHWQKITSPIQIKSDNWISSAKLGFRTQKKLSDNSIVPGPPAYDDLVKQFRKEFKYKIEKNAQEMWVFNGKFWEAMPEFEIKAWAARKIKLPTASTTEIVEFYGRVLVHGELFTHMEFIAKTARKMNFNNVVLDLETLETAAHDPSYGFTYVLPYDYDPHARCPIWDDFLLHFADSNEEIRNLLEEFAGYCISGDSTWLEVCLILAGDGNNGKSVFVDTLKAVAGNRNVSSVPIQNLKSPTDKYNLLNKLFNVSDETSETALMDAELLKSLVTGGTYQVKKLYQDQFEVENRTKFIINTNHEPIVADRTMGFFRRLIIFNIEQQFEVNDPRIDPHLREKLRHEAPGILYRLILAYRRVKDRGKLIIPQKFVDEMEVYKETSNTVAMFVRDACTFEKRSYCKVSEFYHNYKEWCFDHGHSPSANKKISTHLKKTKKVVLDRQLIDGKQVRIYGGIKFRPPEMGDRADI